MRPARRTGRTPRRPARTGNEHTQTQTKKQYGTEEKLHVAHRHDVLPLRDDFVRDGPGQPDGRDSEESVRRAQLDVAAGQCGQLHRLRVHGAARRPDVAAHRLQEDGTGGRCRGIRRRRHPVPRGTRRRQRLRRIPCRRLRVGLLDVHAQHGGEPHAQHAGRRRQDRQPAHTVRRHAQLALGHNRTGARGLPDGRRRPAC